MSDQNAVGEPELRTLFHQCRQCGTCCRTYRKVPLQAEEAAFIRKMGGHVGVEISLRSLRTRSMEELVAEETARGQVYMIHPDDRGCVFLRRCNQTSICTIYHHRPRACRGFRCTMADSSFFDLFGAGTTQLLGQDAFGAPLAPSAPDLPSATEE